MKRGPVSVVTAMRLLAPPERVWERLMFYEEIPGRPPIHLRLLLPVPTRAEGSRSAVGEETRCVYERGHLLKRVTRIDPGREYAFEVVEQTIEVGGGIRLLGGRYVLRALPDGTTRAELETRYLSPRRPAWLWRPIEAAVCRAFHRYILGAMSAGLSQLAISPTTRTRVRSEFPGR